MPVKSRAAIAFEPGAPLSIATVDVADPGPHEVLIRLATAGLCHSDLTFIEGKLPHPMPTVFGHEGLGRVVRNGPGVTTVAHNDTVIPYLVPDCGKCVYCLSGRTNQCVEMGRSSRPGFPTWFSLNGEPVRSFLGLGTFSEYLVVPEDQVQKVNPAAPPEEGCCIGCGVTTGLGAALIIAKVDPGSSVVVIGLGGVGLSVVQGARIAGAKTIIGVDVNPDKEVAARRFGATHFVNGREQDLISEVMKLTGIGADYAFDCVGSGPLFKMGLACLSRGGWARMTSVGINHDSEPVPIVWSDLNGRIWNRAFMGGAKRQDMARYVDWFVDGKIDLDEMVTHRLKLDEINFGFDLMRQGKTNRAVIVFD